MHLQWLQSTRNILARKPLFRYYSQNYKKSSKDLKWSYLIGPCDAPYLDLTIGRATSRAADIFGDQEAIVSCHQNIRKTYSQLNQESEQLAAGFLALGLKPGDRLGIWGPNSYEWLLTQYAAGKAGLILVNINPSYRPNELEFCLNKVSVKGIVCAEKYKTSDYFSMLTKISPQLPNCIPGELNTEELPFLKTVIMMGDNKRRGTFSFAEALSAGGSENRREKIQDLEHKIQFDDPCNIQFTSGTTGLPKAAVLSHHNIVNNAYFVGRRLHYEKRPKICAPVPMYHCFGCVVAAMASTLFGCSLTMPSAGFDPRAIIDCFKNERPNSCYGTPTMFVDIVKEFRKNPVDVSSLFCGIMTGAPCPQELITAVMDDLNMKDFITVYGLTETSPVTFLCFPDDDPDIRASTIGFPNDHTEAKIVDGNGRLTRIEESGELLIRGYCNFLGYWEDEQKTKETITPDRWLKTGDLASMNKDGYATIRGRIKDMVIRGGENIYPAELENFFMGHSSIIEAQVFGVPDSRMGEEVALWVRVTDDSKLTPQDIKDWSKEKIARFKIPKYILIKDEFPTTVTGKIQKFKMKELTMKELGIS